MIKKLKWVFVIFLGIALVITIGFVGCKTTTIEETTSSAETTAAETNAAETTAAETTVEKVELTFWSWQWVTGEATSTEKWLMEEVKKFQELNPNIIINGTNVAYQEFWEKIDLALAGGNPPDVWALNTTNFGKYVENNALLALDDYYNMDDLRKNFTSLQTELLLGPDGKTYAQATYVGFYLPLYRPSVFKEAGISEYAKTPDEFIEMLKKLQSGGRYGYSFMVLPGNYVDAFYDYILWTIGFGGHFAKGDQPALNSPENIEAMTYLKKIFDAGLVPKDIDKSTVRKMLATKKIGTLIDGMWVQGIAAAEDPTVEGDFASAPLPFPTQRVASFTEPLVASAVTKHPKEAAKFLEFLGSKESLQKMTEYSPTLPARLDSLDEQFKTKLIEKYPWYEEFLNHAKSDLMINMTPPSEFPVTEIEPLQKIWNNYMDKVFYENMDVTEAMNAAQEEALALRK